MTEATRSHDYAALEIKVDTLESDVREVKDSILGLDSKLEKSIGGLANELRTSIAAQSGQLAERQRTPWAVLIPGAALMVTVLGFYGSQALSPIQSDLKTLKDQIVSREEINFRSEANNRRMQALENMAETLQRRRYEETREEVRRLQSEIDYLKRTPTR